MFVIPRGVEHRPIAELWAVVLLIERPETLSSGTELHGSVHRSS